MTNNETRSVARFIFDELRRVVSQRHAPDKEPPLCCQVQVRIDDDDTREDCGHVATFELEDDDEPYLCACCAADLFPLGIGQPAPVEGSWRAMVPIFFAAGGLWARYHLVESDGEIWEMCKARPIVHSGSERRQASRLLVPECSVGERRIVTIERAAEVFSLEKEKDAEERSKLADGICEMELLPSYRISGDLVEIEKAHIVCMEGWRGNVAVPSRREGDALCSASASFQWLDSFADYADQQTPEGVTLCESCMVLLAQIPPEDAWIHGKHAELEQRKDLQVAARDARRAAAKSGGS